MQGIERIVDRIQQEAVEEANQIALRAEEQAKKLLEEADAESDKLDAQKAAEAENAAADIRRRAESTARLNTQKASLTARQAILSEVFDRALQNLRGMEKSRYTAFLAKLIVDNAQGGEQVWFAERDKEISNNVIQSANAELEKANKASVAFGGCSAQQADGIILKAGPVATNCTLDALLREARPSLTGEVAAMLF